MAVWRANASSGGHAGDSARIRLFSIIVNAGKEAAVAAAEPANSSPAGPSVPVPAGPDTGEAGLFELPARYRALQDEARTLAASVADVAAEADESDTVHSAVRARLAASGLAAVTVPREFGGRHERVDSLAVTVVREVLAGTSAHLDPLFAMQGIGSYPVTAGGSEAVRRRWLPAVARLDAIAALALTEPGVGSDLKAIRATAREHDGDLIVDAHKSFITNAGDADFYCVLAREGDGYSLVLCPRPPPA
jgi:acyl-CoA dehydrogenase